MLLSAIDVQIAGAFVQTEDTPLRRFALEQIVVKNGKLDALWDRSPTPIIFRQEWLDIVDASQERVIRYENAT